ncbi:MAG TPA: zinc dependent phospholipase C family protein [Halanaerobiales bacterium]|nr:zinc dependent phospholipase C family protein [Halanaerobiales bacterium]
MPDLWTHIIGGDMVVNDLNDRALCNVILENRAHFNMGTQGPDFFFYNDFWPWIENKKGPSIGTLVHTEKQAEFMLAIFDILREKEGALQYPKALSYFMGFVTHMIMDDKFHRIINERTYDESEHKRFELELDCVLVKNYYNEDCHKLSPTSYIKIGDDLDDLIKDIYYLNITKLYDKSIDFKVINKSYQDMIKAQNILYSPFKIKAALFNLLNNFLSIDLNQYLYANVNNFYVLTQKDVDDIEKLFPKFVTTSIDFLNEISLYLKGKKSREKLKELIDGYLTHGFLERR